MLTQFRKEVKRTIIFSFLLFPFAFFSQTIIRNSDSKIFDEVVIVRNDNKLKLNKLNFKNFTFNLNDKVFYENKLLDFSINDDTLFFFDKVNEIEGIQLVQSNLVNKKTKKIRSNRNNIAMADIFLNMQTATLISLNSKKRTFLKAFTLYPEIIENTSGNLEIQILPNIKGLPDHSAPILTFEKDLSTITKKRWEIILPRIIKFPESGLFLIFNLKNGQKRNVALRLNQDSQMYMFYPQFGEWRKMNNNSYHMELKILQ